MKAHPLFGNKVPAGRVSDVTLPHPERTAYKIGSDLAGDYTFREWPSRGAMLTTIRMQESSSRSYITGLPIWRAWQVCRDVARGEPCPHGLDRQAH